jgi:hypothetical protein
VHPEHRGQGKLFQCFASASLNLEEKLDEGECEGGLLGSCQ